MFIEKDRILEENKNLQILKNNLEHENSSLKEDVDSLSSQVESAKSGNELAHNETMAQFEQPLSLSFNCSQFAFMF
jgi:hypothetical protein